VVAVVVGVVSLSVEAARAVLYMHGEESRPVRVFPQEGLFVRKAACVLLERTGGHRSAGSVSAACHRVGSKSGANGLLTVVSGCCAGEARRWS
jgi:hypothetical protein